MSVSSFKKRLENKKDTILTNIAGLVDVDVEKKPLIYLGTIIDRSFFINHLKPALNRCQFPEGANIANFYDGYLTYIESDKLSEKDGKERNTPLTPVLMTRDRKTIIELPESVLKPINLGSRKKQVEQEAKTTSIDEFGNKRTPSNSEARVSDENICSFYIEDPNNEFSDHRIISFKKNAEYARENRYDKDGYNIELYFETISKKEVPIFRDYEIHEKTSQELQPHKRAIHIDRSEAETQAETGLAQAENYETATLERQANAIILAIMNKQEEMRKNGETKGENQRNVEELNDSKRKELQQKIMEQLKQGKNETEILAEFTSKADRTFKLLDEIQKAIGGEDSSYTRKDILNEIISQRAENPNISDEDLKQAVINELAEKVLILGGNGRTNRTA